MELLQVMLTDRSHVGGLRSFDADLLREAHLLADAQSVECAPLDAIAVKVDVTPVRGANEPVIAIGI